MTIPAFSTKQTLFYICLSFSLYYLLGLGVDIYYAFHVGWSDFFNTSVRAMQNTIFFFAFFTLWTKQLQLKNFVYVIPFAFAEIDYSVFSNYFHPILFHLHFYNLFSSQPNNISPEYTRILFFLFLIIVYLIKIIKKPQFKQIFLTLSMMGIFFTAILFHFITLKQLDYYNQQQNIQIKQLMQINEINTFYSDCGLLQLECHVYNNNINLFEQPIDSFVKNYIPNIQPYWNKSRLFYYYTVSNDNTIQDRILSRKPVVFLKNEHLQAIIIDQNNYTQYLKFNQVMFGILAFCSHIVWLFGAIYLIHFHNKKMLNKLKINT